MTRFRPLASSLAVLALVASFAAGCGSSDSEGFRSSGSKIDGDPSTTLPAELASTKSSIKPAVPKATGSAPSDLRASDVVVGKGPEAKSGDKVSVQYSGVLFNGGKEFDSSWKRGAKPFEFTLGQGQVIKGWDEGVPGMKAGGRRVLVIPADQAYGAQGSPPTIPANAPLIFVVDLKKISKG
jgi:FKBP-type peptidyl-prolyl cis-trans isomerase